MTYQIIGICANGSEELVSDGFTSKEHCYASATNAAIKLKHSSNPCGIIRLSIRDEDNKVLSELEGVDPWLYVKKGENNG